MTNTYTKKYFIPALTLKFIGAISLGLIYELYYSGGDTSNYFKFSNIIHDAFKDDFSKGLQLLFANGEFNPDILEYSSRITWYHSPAEYFIIKTATLFGLFCGHTYSVIALFFACFSFLGSWALFNTFLKIFPGLSKPFAFSIFYLPSIVFWGSGLMKDSLTFGALGFLFWAFYTLFIEKKASLIILVIGFFSAWLLFTVKTYILLCFLPPALLWVFNENSERIKNKLVKIMVKPIFFTIGIVLALLSTQLTEGDARYDLENIAERTKINYEYLTVQVATGSAYNIGTFDGTIEGMLAVAPQAIVVSLYRPFIWEVRNPFMFLSALESLVMLFLTLKIFIKIGFIKTFKLITSKPIVLFCMIFSMIFAFAVGTNSGNFGTLVRYKIPLMPFYLSGLFIMHAITKNRLKPKQP